MSADLGRSKQDFEGKLGVLAVLISDLLYIKEAVPEKMVNVDIQERLDRMARKAPVERLLSMAEFLRFIESGSRNYVNRQMLTDVLAMMGNPATAAWLS
jgi:DNA polymerase III gamma/tau subunit